MAHPVFPIERPLLDPAPEFAKWRAEEPVRRVTIWGDNSPWLITRHEDARTVLADPRFSADATLDGFPGFRPQSPPRLPGQFFMMDPPDHTRLRRVLIPDFTFRRVEQLRPAVARICAELLDSMTADGATTADLVESYALPLPSLTICELLGVPYEDHDFFQRQAKAISSLTSGPEEMTAARKALSTYLGELLDLRSREPADDLISRLAQDRVATGEVTAAEAVGIAMLLLVAGHETTANMFPLAVEELLRHLTVAHTGLRRIATEDVEVAGVRIRAGEGVVVAIHAANRDPAAFPDPDELDVRRNAAGHLAFGHGLHQCIGQSLARAELQTGLPTLFDRLPNLRLTARPEDSMLVMNSINGVRALPVEW
ncbi:cytochrome P450 [Streptomyces ipomoeae]|jgi:cytochrome P450|uniref:Unspecific monooxygenase n=1 Tax=Streptomyces ipomoeae 91-03 TaxID=698759 RepID=L1KYB7_9ACTN|nr:cytochrome P450 [Streptomyces ipomoeae]EKX65490.1 unspecific monooxygenase [Streptomyces ipomoeae 91-03]MDX2698505.1 cytochrome P450 [Streptomyces ipomoeae]MDX2825789.1 cytochrome P450 [Streptomyces ipomoeae]MDX2844205.1 cytochrome P450 [Streptomyces ipomoeae]MDX2878475.1 cytochrome P450 [Streptomyces ipomoeae]